MKFKKAITILLLIFATSNLYSQQDSLETKEFFINGNFSGIESNSTKPGIGFGISGYNIFLPGKTITISGGIELNTYTIYYKYGSISSYHDIKYRYYGLMFPMKIRLNIGKKTKIFFEAGNYGEFILYWHETRFYRIHYLNTTVVIDKLLSKHGYGNMSTGILAGTGISIPFSFYSIICKIEYKADLRTYTELYHEYIRLSLGIRIKDKNINKLFH